jgi:hypothetical protein
MSRSVGGEHCDQRSNLGREDDYVYTSFHPQFQTQTRAQPDFANGMDTQGSDCCVQLHTPYTTHHKNQIWETDKRTRRDDVSVTYSHDIARHELSGGYGSPCTVPQHSGLHLQLRRQGLQCLLYVLLQQQVQNSQYVSVLVM